MANHNIGRVACAHCGNNAGVRRYARGSRALYYYCAECGIIRPNLPRGQQWITDNATFYAESPAANEPQHAAPAPAANDDNAAPRRRGLLGGIDL